MAIVALIFAGLLAWLARGRTDPGTGRLMLAIAAVAAGFALYLIVFEPGAAWDLRWVGRLVTKLAGHAARDLLR